LARRAFVHLEGVTDEWIEKTEVEKLTGGQALPMNDGSGVASALASKVDDSCCARRLATAQ
jgi:hypothetical protein